MGMAGKCISWAVQEVDKQCFDFERALDFLGLSSFLNSPCRLCPPWGYVKLRFRGTSKKNKKADEARAFEDACFFSSVSLNKY